MQVSNDDPMNIRKLAIERTYIYKILLQNKNVTQVHSRDNRDI